MLVVVDLKLKSSTVSGWGQGTPAILMPRTGEDSNGQLQAIDPLSSLVHVCKARSCREVGVRVPFLFSGLSIFVGEPNLPPKKKRYKGTILGDLERLHRESPTVLLSVYLDVRFAKLVSVGSQLRSFTP